MKTSLLCPWVRQAHAYLRAGEEKWGKPFGMTYEELRDQVGRPPFTDEDARGLLARVAGQGWIKGVREPAPTSRKGGSQVRVRYFVVRDLPAAPPTRVKRESYFDGLVRASSVFELAQIVGKDAAGGSGRSVA
jgi:hypothetical protein